MDESSNTHQPTLEPQAVENSDKPAALIQPSAADHNGTNEKVTRSIVDTVYDNNVVLL